MCSRPAAAKPAWTSCLITASRHPTLSSHLPPPSAEVEFWYPRLNGEHLLDGPGTAHKWCRLIGFDSVVSSAVDNTYVYCIDLPMPQYEECYDSISDCFDFEVESSCGDSPYTSAHPYPVLRTITCKTQLGTWLLAVAYIMTMLRVCSQDKGSTPTCVVLADGAVPIHFVLSCLNFCLPLFGGLLHMHASHTAPCCWPAHPPVYPINLPSTLPPT